MTNGTHIINSAVSGNDYCFDSFCSFFDSWKLISESIQRDEEDQDNWFLDVAALCNISEVLVCSDIIYDGLGTRFTVTDIQCDTIYTEYTFDFCYNEFCS